MVPLEQPITARGERETDERCISDASFVSAKEDFGSKVMSRDQTPLDTEQRDGDDDNDVTIHPTSRTPKKLTPAKDPAQLAKANSPEQENDLAIEPANVDEPSTPSDGSSPEKPLIRKSSLNFASLPAREPLTGKKSLGPQSSRPSYLSGMTNRASHIIRSLASSSQDSGTQINQETKTKSSDTNSQPDNLRLKEQMEVDSEEPPTKLHNKTSTQRLHDRITMLGQSKEPRPSKSTAPKTSLVQPNYPRLPLNDGNGEHGANVDDEEKTAVDASTVIQEYSATEYTKDETRTATDDVKDSTQQHKNTEKELPPRPIEIEDEVMPDYTEEGATADASRASSGRPGLYSDSSKASSFTALSSATGFIKGPGSLPQKPVSVSNPEVQQQEKQWRQNRNGDDDIAKQHTGSTTPLNSPKRNAEGPLSASKAKLYSVLKSAKGIFASSASVSAQARLEMLTPPPQQQGRPKGSVAVTADDADKSADSLDANGKKVLLEAGTDRNHHATKSGPHGAEPQYPLLSGKAERDDKKREKGAKELLRLENELEKARAREREKATIAAHKPDKPFNTKSENEPTTSFTEKHEHEKYVESNTRSMVDVPENTSSFASMPPPTKSTMDAKRPTKKPSKDTLPRAKPAPVSIKVASQLVSIHSYQFYCEKRFFFPLHSNAEVGGTCGSFESLNIVCIA